MTIRRRAFEILLIHRRPAAPDRVSRGIRVLKRGPQIDAILVLARFCEAKSRMSLALSWAQSARDLARSRASDRAFSFQNATTFSFFRLRRRTMGTHSEASAAGRCPCPAKALGQKTRPSQSFSLGSSG